MEVSNYPQVNHRMLKRIARNSARVRRPLIVIGRPGVGKTAVMGKLAKSIGRKLVCFDLGNGAREDAMLPVKVDTPTGPMVVRIPLEALAQSCQAPVVLFIDEVTRADKNKQAVAMALANERRIGSYTLHPGTLVVMAGNDGSSSGTFSLTDALVNRCCIVNLVPERDEMREIIAGLAKLGDDEHEAEAPFMPDVLSEAGFKAKLEEVATEYAAIAAQRTELLQLEPPEGAQESCAQWASPRQVHHALDRIAATLNASEPADEVLLAEVGGCIGREAAAALFAVLGNKDKLPTVDEVVTNPTTAKLPPDVEAAIAGLALMAGAFKRDKNASWVYLDRFAGKFPELQGVLVKDAQKHVPTAPGSLALFNKLVGKTYLISQRTR
jgi:MoxR-like ATPase